MASPRRYAATSQSAPVNGIVGAAALATSTPAHVLVAASPPPTTGQVLQALGATTASWQTLGGSPATELDTTGAPVDVSAASPPSAGQVLTATGATAATWQTPSAGGVQDDPTVRTSGFTASANTRYYLAGNGYTVYMPAGPSDGDVVAFASVGLSYTPLRVITLDGNGALLTNTNVFYGNLSSLSCYLNGPLELAFRYYAVTGRWEPIAASSIFDAGLWPSVEYTDDQGRPSVADMSSAYSVLAKASVAGVLSSVSLQSDGVLGRCVGGSLRSLTPYEFAHNLYSSSGYTHGDATTGLSNPWPGFSFGFLHAHTTIWTGASDLIVAGAYSGGDSDSHFRQDKLILNNTGSQGSGTFKNIIWRKESSAASTIYRIRFEAPDPSSNQAEYVQTPGTCVLLRWEPSTQRWHLSAAFPSGGFDRGVVTTTAVATTIHTHTTNTNSRLIMYKAQVEAVVTSGTTVGDAALFDVTALFFRDSVGTVTQKDVTFVNGPYKDAGAAAWDVTFNISGSNISMQVTGDSGDTIRWRVVGQITEHG